MTIKPRLLMARAVFPEVLDRLSKHFEVQANQADTVWSKAELIERLQGKQAAFTTGGDRIDAEVLAACPELKICANLAVGYNNKIRATRTGSQAQRNQIKLMTTKSGIKIAPDQAM